MIESLNSASLTAAACAACSGAGTDAPAPDATLTGPATPAGSTPAGAAPVARGAVRSCEGAAALASRVRRLRGSVDGLGSVIAGTATGLVCLCFSLTIAVQSGAAKQIAPLDRRTK